VLVRGEVLTTGGSVLLLLPSLDVVVAPISCAASLSFITISIELLRSKRK
jgi:hypothetical protein